MADRNVVTTDTLEVFRTTYNSTAEDVGDMSTKTFSESDLVEAVNAASSKGFSIAMAVALGQRIKENAINNNWNRCY